MPGRHDSGRCSFCGRAAEESGPLFSGGAGRICARCIDAAVHALDHEELGGQPAATLERHVERYRRLSERLLTLALDRPGALPMRVVDALEKVTVSSRALDAAVRRWAEGEEGSVGSDPQARFEHVASKLVALLRPLRGWRASLPGTVPHGQLYAVDQAITVLATLAKILDDPEPEGSGRKR
jgi:hypothetical protein